MNEAAIGADEPKGSRIVFAARIVRTLVLLLAVAAIGLVVDGWMSAEPRDWPDWLQHGVPGALAALLLIIELLTRLAAALAGAVRAPSSVGLRASYVAFALFLLLTAGAGYVALATSAPEPVFLGVSLAPIEPDLTLADSIFQLTGLQPALGDVGQTPLGAASAAAHRLFAAGAAASLFAYLVLLMLQALRPAPGALAWSAMAAGQVSPEAQAFGGRLRFGGWLIFWLQLLITISSALMFQLAQPGRAPAAERLPWYSEPIGWGLVALSTMGVSLALAFLYTRLSRPIIAHPERHLDPRRLFALWFLSLGILVGFFGVVTSFVALAMSVWTLIGKIVSQPPGIAITDPTNFIRMLDMLILIANIELLMGHVLGVGVTQWLRIHASKARLDMLHALVEGSKTPATPNSEEVTPTT